MNRSGEFKVGSLWGALRARKPAGTQAVRKSRVAGLASRRKTGPSGFLHSLSGLEELKNARRPLLFSRMPRMLRDDGRTPDALQHRFRYVESNAAVVPATTVSSVRWHKALAMSLAISRRRQETDRHG
jgi:hypothetical protein